MTMKESAGRVRTQQQETRQRKQGTKKLEEENKKMEVRLQELKMAMNREKEEREVQDGGGFWGKGQTGSLLNYKVEPQKKATKVKKIGVLKDDPIVIQKRPSGPGTMAFLAQNDPAASRPSRKMKGPRCGQCEDRPAAVACQECGEDYCTKCFAVFHLKGALRKHRTTPISTLTPRSANSARQLVNEELAVNKEEQSSLLPPVRPNAEPSAGGGLSSEALASARDEAQLMIQEMMRSQERQPATNGSLPKDSQRLSVHFAEDEDFTADVMEFACDVGVGGSSYRAPLPQKEVADSAIGTDDPVSRILLGQPPHRDQEDAQPDIHFTTSLSYAERLLLRQNRRRQLERLEDASVELRQPIRKEEELRSLARQQALQTKFQNMALELEISERAEEEHVDFQALCDLTELAQEPTSGRSDPEPVTVPFPSRVTIQEEDFLLAAVSDRPPRPGRVCTKEARNTNRKFLKELHNTTNGSASPDRRLDNHSEALETVGQVGDQPIAASSQVSGSAAVKVGSRLSNRSEPMNVPPAVDNRYGNRSPAVKSRPSSRLNTPRSARRIPDVPRPTSRRATDSARRIHNLTSKAGDELRAVANLRNAADFRPAAGDDGFLMLGLGRRGSSDASSSRASSRPSSASHLANRFYSFGPRSWRPESSLRNEANDPTEPVEAAALHDPSDDLPNDLQAEVAALEAMAMVAATPPASPVPTMHQSFAPPSRASTTLTAVTSRSLGGQSSIVIDGDDFSSFDRMQPEEEEEEREREEMKVLERGISSQRGASRSFFLNDVDEDCLDASEEFALEDSLEMRRSLSLLPADHDDSDSLDSLDTARYDDAVDVRGLQ